PITPRFSVTSVDLFRPVTFMTLFSLAFPARYSATVTSMPRLLHSWNPASTLSTSPSALRSTRKLNCAYGRSRLGGCAIFSLPSLLLPGVGRPLADPEDHELGGLDHGDADQADETAVVEVVLRHRRA